LSDEFGLVKRRAVIASASEAWMAGTSPAMTIQGIVDSNFKQPHDLAASP
jgi:hypothetical protein